MKGAQRLERSLPLDEIVGAISVVIVSDYAAGGPEAWKGIRRTLTALSSQRIESPVEFLLCESEQFRDLVPPDLASLLPSLRILFFPALTAYELKNEGVRAASGEFIALLDADCIPGPGWLSGLRDVLVEHPEAAAVSGKTTYSGVSLSIRVCALLGRSYLDPGSAGPTRFVAMNNSAFRRSAYLACPLPTGIGTFSSRIQSEGLRRLGWKLRFNPVPTVVHDFEGWSIEADFRRNCGYGTIRTRIEDPALPYSWLVKLGPVGIAPILIGKVLESWGDCGRCYRHYGLRWYELPAACLVSVAIHLLEIPGMLQAFRRTGLPRSAFR